MNSTLKRCAVWAVTAAALVTAGAGTASAEAGPARSVQAQSGSPVEGMKVTRGANGLLESVIMDVQATGGWHVAATADGRLQFLDAAGAVAATWDRVFHVRGLTIIGEFSTPDASHVRYDIRDVQTDNRHVGFGDWLSCVGKDAGKGAIGGAVAGCAGGIWAPIVGCLVGGVVGGGAAGFGATLGGMLFC